MNKRYSYLDSLNAGRERRPEKSYDDLSRALDSLESTFESLAGKRTPTERNQRSESAPRWEQPQSRRERDTWLDSRHDKPSPQTRASGFDLGGLARDIDRTRAQEDSLSSITRIAADLTALRRDLRGEMTQALGGQFETLRKDIETLYRSAMQGRGDPAVAVELQRISAAISMLAEQKDDRTLNVLLGEMDTLKQAVGDLAQNSAMQELGRQWDEFGNRFDTVERHLSALPAQSHYSDLDERLAQIAHAVGALPESLPIRSLEEKVRTLAGAIDHFSRTQDNPTPRSIEAIEERLDEIARAIVATSASIHAPQMSNEPFERIEARISSLSRQVEELSAQPAGKNTERAFSELADRIDRLAEHADLPKQAIERLTDQISRMANMLDGVAGQGQAIRSFENRFESLAETLQHQQETSVRQGIGQVRAVEQRMEELFEKIGTVGSQSDASGLVESVESRLAEISHRMGELNQGADPGAMQLLVRRLDDISDRLNSARGPVQSIDPDLVRNLETQVAGLSALLSRPDHSGALPDDVALRLDRLESAVAISRDSVLSAARQAAEEAIRIAPGNPNGPAILALADDLKTLDTLARRADERSTRTFEAIHETLLKIVDRLVMLEHARPAPATPAKLSIEPSPALEHEPQALDMPESPVSEPNETQRAARSPAQAASEAAFAAIERKPAKTGAAPANKKSLLGGLTKALTNVRKPKADNPVAVLAGDQIAENGAEATIDPAIANQPLEPGAGAPDLDAIMRRVRSERKDAGGAADAGQSDFIAAARRHAQAAAAEAESLKRRSATPSDKAGGLLDMAKQRRKPILMAIGAIVIALSGLQLGKMLLTDEPSAQTAMQLEEPSAAKAPDTVAAPSAAETTSPAPETANGAPDVRMATPLESPPAPATSAAASIAAPVVENVAAPQSAPAELSPPANAGPFALVEAAKAGDAKAFFEIGNRYADGRNGDANMTTAAQWMERAAEQGLAPAQYRVGNFYEKGTGVGRDIAKAKTWYQMAAEQGNASAMHNLAVLYATGAGEAVDNDSAARWFLSAAELGVKDSQFNLGILAAKGIGMPQSLEDSYKWFALAAKSGDKDAAAKRDEVAKALRPDQLEKARGATELWQPKPLDANVNTVEVPPSWSDGDGQTASVDMGKAIRNIQAILNKQGYDAGSPDGVMGGKTKTAIAAYQKANGMAATGEVDEALVRSLLGKK